MRKIFLFSLGLILLIPSLGRAIAPQAQEYERTRDALYRQGLVRQNPWFIFKTRLKWILRIGRLRKLGNAYLKLNNTSALTAYQKPIQINPDNITVKISRPIFKKFRSSATKTIRAKEQQQSITPPPSRMWKRKKPIQNDRLKLRHLRRTNSLAGQLCPGPCTKSSPKPESV